MNAYSIVSQKFHKAEGDMEPNFKIVEYAFLLLLGVIVFLIIKDVITQNKRFRQLRDSRSWEIRKRQRHHHEKKSDVRHTLKVVEGSKKKNGLE